MRNLMITMSVLTLISCSLGGAVQAQPNVHQQDFAIENIADGIYVHHGQHLDIDTGYQGDICNVSFVVGSKGVAVIDTGGSLKVGRQLREAIRNITPLPVLYVINTHVHPDHIYGNAAFLEDKPAFVGHEKLAGIMELRREQYAKLNAKLLHEEATGSDLVKPTHTVKDKLTLDVGDRRLEVTAHPAAHTTTDISLLDVNTGTLFAGDLLFIERTPVVEADIKGLIAEIEQLKRASASQVVPGHGPVSKEWKTALNNAQRYLHQLLTDVRSSIRKNEGMEKAMETAAAGEKQHWLLFEVANRRNVNTIYPGLEWE